jgi:hypothetical protein
MTGSTSSAAVMTWRGQVVRPPARPRVSRTRPYAIDERGVTLHLWPLRSIFIPRERVDRFEVVLVENPFVKAGMSSDGVECLALITRDGEELPALEWRPDVLLIRRYGLPPLRARAQQLNNLLLQAYRTRPGSATTPPRRSQMRRRRPPATIDATGGPGDTVTVMTWRGRVVRSPGPPRVSHSRAMRHRGQGCHALSVAAAVRLHPRERDDRFAVVHPVLEQALGPNDVEGTLTCDNGVWTGPNVDSPEPDGTGGIGGIAA